MHPVQQIQHGVRALLLSALLLGALANSASALVPLTPIATGFNSPIGIDHHVSTNKVLVSVNYPTGSPFNFELINPDGSHSPYSSISGLTEEIKIACVRPGPNLGGFVAGQTFTGNGNPGEIVRISPDGATVDDPWATLPGETGLMRGGLFHDRHGAFGGDLIAVTTAGGVWRVNAAGTPTFITRITGTPTHLEGVSTIPADPARYGPWAGRIVTGNENVGLIYAVDASGNVTTTDLDIDLEDIELIPFAEHLYVTDYAGEQILGAPASAFGGMVGDILITDAGEVNVASGGLYRVRWNAATSSFSAEKISVQLRTEHVTFSPAGIIPFTAASSAINKDFCNNTGTTADGIEILIRGSFVNVLGHYDGPYAGTGAHQPNTVFPSFQVVADGSNTILRWSGTTVPPENFVHVGASVPGLMQVLAVRWLSGSTVLGCARQISTPGSHFTTGVLTFRNVFPGCPGDTLRYVSGIRIEWFGAEVPLSAMNPGASRSPIRTDVIPEPTFAIGPADSLNVIVSSPPGGAAYALIIYEVSATPVGDACVTTDFFLASVNMLEPPPISALNKDLCNNTGVTVDGLEWVIRGSFTGVLGHYDGPYAGTGPHPPNTTYPNFAIIPSGPNTILRWTGVSLPPGNYVHVGAVLPGNPELIGVRWLNGGAEAGCAAQLAAPGTHVRRGSIGFKNVFPACASPRTLRITSLSIEWHATEVALAALNPTTARTPISIHTVPLETLTIPPGESTGVVVPSPPAGARYALFIYSLVGATGGACPTTDYLQVSLDLFEPPAGSGLNTDLCNNTGVAANGIEFIFEGILAYASGHYDGPYIGVGPHPVNTIFSNFTLFYSGGNTICRWAGATIPPANYCHIGVVFPCRPKLLGIQWLNNGSPLGCAKQLASPGTHVMKGLLPFENMFPACPTGQGLKARNIRIEWHANEVPLTAMNPGGVRAPIRVDAIDGEPTVAANSTAAIRVPSPAADARFMLVIYEVAAATGADACITTEFYQTSLEFMQAMPPPSFLLDVSPPRPPLATLELLRPNPTSGATTLAFSLEHGARVKLRVHDISGRLVRAMDLGHLPAGRHETTWDGHRDDGGVARAGLYFLALEIGGRRFGARPLVVVR